MFGIGTQEMIIILIIAFIVFGAKNLPNLGKSLGQAITGFKKGLEDSEPENGNPSSKQGTGKTAGREKTS